MKYFYYNYYISNLLKISFLDNEFCQVNGILSNFNVKIKKNNFYQLTNNLCFFKKQYIRTFFSIISKVIDGVSYGFKGILQLKGKGLRFQFKKKDNNFKLFLKLGYSHKIFLTLPKNIWLKLYERRRTLYLYTLNYELLRQIILKIKYYYPLSLYKIRGFLELNEVYKLRKYKAR